MKHDNMHEPPRRNDGREPGDPQEIDRLKAAMRARGWLKLVLVTMAGNQVLTTAFAYVAQQLNPGFTVFYIRWSSAA